MVLSEIDQKLVDEGYLWVDEQGKRCFTSQESLAKQKALKNLEMGENTRIILGYPKSGSHLMKSIFDELKIQRIEELEKPDESKLPPQSVLDDLNRDGKMTDAEVRILASRYISPFPLEFQASEKAYSEIEKLSKETDQLVHLPHCHVLPEYWPKNFKGRAVYIERDSRAVANSAWHFFGLFYKRYFEAHGLTDVNLFAKHYFEQKLPWGRSEQVDKRWKEFAKANPEQKILFVKYEGLNVDFTKK